MVVFVPHSSIYCYCFQCELWGSNTEGLWNHCSDINGRAKARGRCFAIIKLGAPHSSIISSYACIALALYLNVLGFIRQLIKLCNITILSIIA